MRAIIGTLAALAVLSSGSIHAQQGGFTGSSGGGSSGGGFTGSSGGGVTGSGGGFTGSSGGGVTGSSGGFTGSSGGGVTGSSGGFTGSSSGGFTGSSSGGFTGTTSGGASGRTGGTGTTRPGSTSFLGATLGNPYAMGMRTGTSSGTTGTYPTTNYTNTSSAFGQPVYNISGTAGVSRTGTTGSALGTTGTSGLGLATNRLGTSGLGSAQGLAQSFTGATSGGVRRAPQYTTQPVFDRLIPRPTITSIRPDLHAVLSSSTRLPSAGRIQVTTDGDKVVLRGTVTTERERRIAEHMIRMTPGVREVSNELKATSSEEP